LDLGGTLASGDTPCLLAKVGAIGGMPRRPLLGMTRISRPLEGDIIVVVLTYLEALLTQLEPICAVLILILPFTLEDFISIIGGGSRLHLAKIGRLSLGQ
jgi:hypothetical protein